MSSLEQTIFKNASSTFYPAALMFPKEVREDIFRLYSFVRIADDYVDVLPQNKKAFQQLRFLWQEAKSDRDYNTTPNEADDINQHAIKNIIQLTRKYDVEFGWIDIFLDTMQSDLDFKQPQTLEDALSYVYGSAEIVGLMMAKIMRLPDEALIYARLQGRAFQWINFIRDIDEDNRLGRCYFPLEHLQQFGLKDLSKDASLQQEGSFKSFIDLELDLYSAWQKEATDGLCDIPLPLKAPVNIAIESYARTSEEIRHDPRIVFNHAAEYLLTKNL